MNEEELKERAIRSLLQSSLGKVSPAEAFVIGWRKGWDEALDVALEIVRKELDCEEECQPSNGNN